jgi:hypothetical protein
LRVRGIGILTYRDVELSVWSKVYRAAVVIRRATEIVKVEDLHFTAHHRDIGVRSVRGKTTDPIVDLWSGCSVVNVNETVSRKVWIKGNTQQAALAVRIYC